MHLDTGNMHLGTGNMHLDAGQSKSKASYILEVNYELKDVAYEHANNISINIDGFNCSEKPQTNKENNLL